ncbi:DNA-binding anti-repressor SinI [Metabacillus litoralis]|nr:DNA-binding anti-repressor SinI [Metabacillus litoralis]MCM3655155.1 anti-repressor SinI family protein [Metabacillus litoralis]
MLKQIQKIEKIDHECVELMRIAKEMGISIQEIREFLGIGYISK